MEAWVTAHKVGDKIVTLADGNADFTRAMGLEMDGSGFGLGTRCQRFAAIIDDGTITRLDVDETRRGRRQRLRGRARTPVNPPAARRPGRSEPAGLDALTASVERLHTLVEALTPTDLRRGAYPTEWTIADVLSHLGSGAVIARMRLDAALAGGEGDTDTVRSVWDVWNAKAPEDQALDAQHADRSLLEGLRSLTPAQRRGFRSTLGPLEVDFAGFVGLRVGEHVLHTWDIAVTFDHDAELPVEATPHLLDNLALIAASPPDPPATTRPSPSAPSTRSSTSRSVSAPTR